MHYRGDDMHDLDTTLDFSRLRLQQYMGCFDHLIAIKGFLHVETILLCETAPNIP